MIIGLWDYIIHQKKRKDTSFKIGILKEEIMSKEKVDMGHDELLKKWCSDCEYKHRTWLDDPCHNCMGEEFVDDVPRYYKEESSKMKIQKISNMNKNQLLDKLMDKYSFEKAHSFIQIATEDGIFEDTDVKITMTRTSEGIVYTLEW